jgi:hypothetical protein
MVSCKQRKQVTDISGTWQLQSGTLIEKKDTTVTDYLHGKRFIKILNASHFAFMGHDLGKSHDSTAFFSAGGGRYTLRDSLYTEHLEYCNDRAWENHDFQFVISLNGDTLIQKGVENVPGTNVSRINIERYLRVAP